ncbi:uncharacterized protein LOC135155643 [Lytechinus pictus]|uniref:uncharacterized protein LOC135155643 n=1 Tax=Lytechinus pictus TaxID=7653 RepID=UPI0030B9F38F
MAESEIAAETDPALKGKTEVAKTPKQPQAKDRATSVMYTTMGLSMIIESALFQRMMIMTEIIAVEVAAYFFFVLICISAFLLLLIIILKAYLRCIGCYQWCCRQFRRIPDDAQAGEIAETPCCKNWWEREFCRGFFTVETFFGFCLIISHFIFMVLASVVVFPHELDQNNGTVTMATSTIGDYLVNKISG